MKKCCRSMPRCANCPARLAAAARIRRELDEPAVLLAEVLGGRPARSLPPAVATALAELEHSRLTR
jgi:hypothetical protein